jgi:hypothetical protein
MCKSKRDLVIEQIELMNHIRTYANINIVTCGHCGSVILHHTDLEGTLTCYDCKSEMDLCDCPDLFYSGMENSSMYDEDEPTQELTQEIDVEDVVKVAMELGMNPSIAEINEVLKDYDSEVDNDPTATWELIVENLLYNCVTPSNIK